MAAVDAVIRKTPRPARFITGSAYFAPRYTPFTLTSKIVSKVFSSTSSTSVYHCGTPALAKKTSSRPHAAVARSTSAWLSAARVTSAVSAMAWPRAPSILCTVAFAPASLTSATSTRAPSAAIATAAAAPMPDPAPVTIATLSRSLIASSLRLQRQLGQRADGDRVAGDQQRRHAGSLPLGHLLADALLRPAERHLVHQRVRHPRLRLRLPARQVVVLDGLRRVLVAVATRDVVVEVPPARAHAADVEREARLDDGAARRDVGAGDDRDHRHDVESLRRAAAGLEALVEPLAEHPAAARREEHRDPAVGDLGGERDVLGPDRSQVDRQRGAAVQDGLQRLAEAGGVRSRVRDLVVLAAELERLLPPEDRAHDLDVLARLDEWLAERLAMPGLDHLRPRDPEAEPEAATGERVERHRGHGRHRRRPRGDLHDAGAHVDAHRARGHPRRRRHGVRAVGLGRPDGVVPQPLGLEDTVDVEGEVRARVVQAQGQSHRLAPILPSGTGRAARARAAARRPPARAGCAA